MNGTGLNMAVEKDERIAADEHVDMPLSASEQMRAARAASGLSLADIAAQTRVPLRHLEALEEGRYGDLPGVTYCAGFARAYAREVGLDDAALVAQLRNDLEDMGDLSANAMRWTNQLAPTAFRRAIWPGLLRRSP